MTSDVPKPLHSGELELRQAPESAHSIQPLAQRSMFWRPAYLERSSWQEHVPFAFWVTEAHRPRTLVELGTEWGVSYFAFCQAVDKLMLDTRCFAVDTWKGDEHAGFYDERVFEQVAAYNTAQYSGFSELVRSSFDEARDYFSDGSVDLLHIDGLHTFEAVSHDFEAWLPKLSDHGLVVLHGTNVRERKFGVFKLFEQLRQKYPTFELAHGSGVGVIGVGVDQTDTLRRLFRATESETAARAIQDVFSRLGRACADSYALRKEREAVLGLREAMEGQTRQLSELGQQLRQLEADRAARQRELGETRAKLQAQLALCAAEREQFTKRIDLLGELRADQKDEIARQRAEIEALSSKLSARTSELASERSVASQERTRARELEATLDATHSSLEQSVGRADALAVENAELRQLAEQKTATLSADNRELTAERQRLTESLQARFREIATLTKMLEEKEDALGEAASRFEEQRQRLGATQAARDAEVARHRAETEELQAALESRANERATLAKALERKDALIAEREAKLREAEARLAALAEAHEGTKKALGSYETQSEAGAKELEQARASESRLARELGARQAELEALHRRIAKLKKSASWRMTAPVRSLAKNLGAAGKQGMAVGEQVALIRASGLLDEAWYRTAYADVAAGGADPVEHYVLYGAAEGRDPSPTFSSKQYLTEHADAASSNPLVHFLQHGGGEATGRAARSAREGGDSPVTRARAMLERAGRLLGRARGGR